MGMIIQFPTVKANRGKSSQKEYDETLNLKNPLVRYSLLQNFSTAKNILDDCTNHLWICFLNDVQKFLKNQSQSDEITSPHTPYTGFKRMDKIIHSCICNPGLMDALCDYFEDFIEPVIINEAVGI